MPWLETAPMERANRLHRRSSARALRHDGALRAVRRQPEDRLQVARPLRGARPLGLGGSESRAASLPASHRARGARTSSATPGAKHPDWGPGKLLDYLAPRHPDIDWPAVSTVNDLLARHGLVQKRRRRRPHQHPGVVPPTTPSPTISGPRTSRASSRRATGSTAIRSPSRISTPASC